MDGASTVIPSNNQQDESHDVQMANNADDRDEQSEHDSGDDKLGDDEDEEDARDKLISKKFPEYM